MNKWKTAFFTLLLLFLIIPIAIAVVLFKDPAGGQLDRSSLDNNIEDNQKLLSIHTEKEQVEDLLNKELRKRAPDVNVYVNLRNDEAVLNGSFIAFDQELPYQVTFEPEVLENGDLLLKEKDMQVGRFPLPGDEVFTLIQKTVAFPEWVDVYPKDESILMRVTEMPTKPGYAIKAEEFDLKKNSIKLGVYTKN
ncbi:YpmS family protein [Fictibacillus sp. 7GRE50]|uniref:YpmS family protein n=1 Tax=unclassified Fictibacillus TaxID=2644029 RepID=UPI0018CE8E01|nr:MULTISPECIES: YpmS family protein [unclassified Fictibacillus]MBH0165365.1 YpmS family protein [Fictibacillus sp. 7GRE50]MBH0172042.1 YpmS family protein [Fictibacillus sp. 23RED33]